MLQMEVNISFFMIQKIAKNGSKEIINSPVCIVLPSNVISASVIKVEALYGSPVITAYEYEVIVATYSLY